MSVKWAIAAALLLLGACGSDDDSEAALPKGGTGGEGGSATSGSGSGGDTAGTAGPGPLAGSSGGGTGGAAATSGSSGNTGGGPDAGGAAGPIPIPATPKHNLAIPTRDIACVILADRTVFCEPDGGPPREEENRGFERLATWRGNGLCGVRGDGTIHCWQWFASLDPRSDESPAVADYIDVTALSPVVCGLRCVFRSIVIARFGAS